MYPKKLPGTPTEVAKYVERVIGPTYFDQPKSLQWNHYLYFVVEDIRDNAVRQSRFIIEQDPTYARKFVIEEEDVEQVLRPSIVQATTATNQVDAVSRWIEALRQPYLVEAVFGSYTRADRLKLTDGTKRVPSSPINMPTPARHSSARLPPLRQFKVETFRPCLRGIDFNFQDVNLLFGVNGAGKTSILEAIELYYCGKHTKRNRDIPEIYKLHVTVRGGTSESVTHSRAVGDFRNRNRDWYGVRELRRSHICDSFGRFNFLNTDAAVDLAKSDEDNVNADLARLLVGSDAAVIWSVIEQLAADVAIELRRVTEAHTQAQNELRLIRKQLADSTTVKTESDSLRAALKDALRRNEWKVDDHDLEGEAGELVEQLSALLSAEQQAVELGWIDAPVTLDKCQEFVNAIREFVEANTPSVQKLESLTTHQGELAASTSRTQQALTLTAELEQLVAAGVERRMSDLAAQRQIITSTSSLLSGIDEDTLATLSKLPQVRSVAGSHADAMESRRTAEAAANDARRESDRFAKVRQRSAALAQQLRHLAREIISEAGADECPLCHTKFKPGELERHMAIGVDVHTEAAAQKLFANVARLENEYRQAIATETALANLVRFCGAAGLSPDTLIAAGMAKLSETQATLTGARERAHALSSEIDSLQARQISLDRLNAVRTQLNALGFGGAYRSSEEVGVLRRSIQEGLRATSEEMKGTAEQIAKLRAGIEAALRPWRLRIADARRAMASLEERRVRTQEILSRLGPLGSRFPWQASRPIGEWIVESERVRGIAAKLQTAMGMERVAAKTLTEITRRRNELQTLDKQLNQRIGRLSEANTVFEAILKDYSLDALTRSALRESHKEIEAIFSQIHSPAEFESIELNGGGWALKRKDGDERVKLTQISTGQRAAFALSVFLAQNAQLTAGPPVILIDDPIAHVDDLNCLSFLDYLREIALAGTRQIFFATASEKLARLFERKFDFLGDRFRRFDLERPFTT